MNKLNVFFEEILVGVLIRDEQLIHSFQYSSTWLNHEKSFPLSLAMPLQTDSFPNKVSLSFFENLLPEGEVRDTLARTHNAEGPYEFLKRFGLDCAGAMIISESETSPYKEQKSERKEIEIEKVFQAIEEHHSVAQVIADMNPGYLSLAGAQDKFSAIYERGAFYLPTKGGPTTHVVKVPINRSGVKESVYNEYFCMKLAQEIGLNVPHCQVVLGGLHPLFVIERYDRVKNKTTVHRLHQQDFCQAQGVVSDNKYESLGGPSLRDNYQVILKNVAIKNRIKSVYGFLDWICFNLLIGNNDSHSKNISLLLRDSKIELAPFYDLLSTAIYPKLKTEFSFKIGGRSKAHEIGIKQIEELELELGLKLGAMSERMQMIHTHVMEKKDGLVSSLKEQFPDMKIAARISDLISDRSKGFRKQGIKL